MILRRVSPPDGVLVCQVLGGPDAHLASIEDATENELVWLLMQSLGNLPGNGANYWLGYVKNGGGASLAATSGAGLTERSKGPEICPQSVCLFFFCFSLSSLTRSITFSLPPLLSLSLASRCALFNTNLLANIVLNVVACVHKAVPPQGGSNPSGGGGAEASGPWSFGLSSPESKFCRFSACRAALLLAGQHSGWLHTVGSR